MVKNLPANAGDIRDMGSIPGVGKIPWRKERKPYLSATFTVESWEKPFH